ncbi:hypothetical protein CAEBREN_22888 [Caenorhabditis brenneri]|uniref:Protein kinase domain-containing protein n=1 Tax=Caenorhabditis brenneri TaxID=135651 RepID=G0MH90_CAEBE|nr:hypothetical protein CAEBREN_22888 [Caenorhabditis brenneri]
MPSQVLVAGLKIKKRYYVRNKLGEGKFGEVYKAYDKVEKMDVALKAVATVNTVEEKEDASAIGEARILLLLNKNKCKGSPQLYDYFSYKSHSILVMELFKTDFHQLLKHHPKKSFSKQSLLHFAYHVIEAIKNIHQIGILHRDIKPANIFLRNDQSHQNPGNVVRGNNGWLKTIVELLLNQQYGRTPRYQEILDEISRHSRIPVTRDFEVVVNSDGTSYLKDF